MKSFKNVRKNQLLKELDKVVNKPNASSNWKQMVLTWDGLGGITHSGRYLNNTNLKNKIIKNTELKRLRYFATRKNLPSNWKKRIESWPDVNQKNKNAVLKTIIQSQPANKRPTYVKSLRNQLLEKIFTLQNVKNKKYIELPNGSKINVNEVNLLRLKNLSGARLLGRLNYNTKSRLNSSILRRGINVYTYTQRYKNRQNVKNFINTIGMMNRVYHPTDYRYKRIVSDIFASTYRLLKVVKPRIERGNTPVSFITRHIRVPANRRYWNPISLETVGNDSFESEYEFNKFLRQYKGLFMETKVLHVSQNKREQIWKTIKNWKGTMAMCIATCNMIYYSSNRTHKGPYNF